jgi:hypothetical protein
MIPGTVGAGVAITARSTGSGTAARLGNVFVPRISAWLGLIRYVAFP